MLSTFYGATDLLGRAMQAVSIFWLAALLSKYEFGNIGLLIAVQQLVMALCLGGLIDVISGRVREIEDELKFNYFKRRVINLYFLVSILVMLGVVFFGELYPLYSNEHALIVAASTGVIFGFLQLIAGFYRLQEEHRHAIKIRTSSQVIGYGFGILVSTIYPSPLMYFYGVLLGLIATIIVFLGKEYSFPMQYDADNSDLSLGSIGLESLPYLFAGLISWSAGYGANFFIAIVLGRESVADYTLVLTLITAILMLANAFNQAWAPRFFSIAKVLSFNQLNKENDKAQVFLQLMLFIGSLFLLIFYPLAIEYWDNKFMAYRGLYNYIAVSLIGVSFLVPYYGSMNFYLLNRSGILFARIIFFSTLLLFPIWYVLMIKFGDIGIYLGWAIATASRCWILAYVSHLKWGSSFMLWPGIISGILITTICFLVNFLNPTL